jgi:hypothetical protein
MFEHDGKDFTEEEFASLSLPDIFLTSYEMVV